MSGAATSASGTDTPVGRVRLPFTLTNCRARYGLYPAYRVCITSCAPWPSSYVLVVMQAAVGDVSGSHGIVAA